MCGFAGFADFRNKGEMAVLQRMIGSIRHRGPDDEGYELFSSGKSQVGLGFCRLSIIDLSAAGHQPMKDEQTGNLIVFNGEVYNFNEIKQELLRAGHTFKSRTDTEVILKAYSQWGKKCVNKFIGMFAIVIYDQLAGKLIFFRDRGGVKPLYYYFHDGLFLFASELKAFHQHPHFKKEINLHAINHYFHHGYISAPLTIFNHTYKLLPGHILEMGIGTGLIQTEKYWSPDDAYNQPELKISFNDALEEMEQILIKACQYRMIADVPVGLFLSGGYDSSAVAALIQSHSMHKLKTFTIGFEDRQFNEAPHARKVAEHLGTDHTEYIYRANDSLELLPRFYDMFDEPFSEAVAIPNYIVSKLAREKVKVALSADGGDEIFAGYTRHDVSYRNMTRYNRIPGVVRKTLAKMMKLISKGNYNSILYPDRFGKVYDMLSARSMEKAFWYINETYSKREIASFLTYQYSIPFVESWYGTLLNPDVTSIQRFLNLEYKTYLANDILYKVDITSMKASLEAREPLMDHHIVEFAARLPSDFKLHGSTGKWILRKIVHRYIPPEIMERPKQGFGLPIPQWGIKELRPFFDDIFTEQQFAQHGLFHFKKVKPLYDFYMQGNINVFDRIWMFISFQMWYNKWMKS